MSGREAARLAFIICGVYALVQAATGPFVSLLWTMWSLLKSEGTSIYFGMVVSMLIPLATLVLGGLYLIRSSTYWAVKLFPSEVEGEGLLASEWQTVAFSVVGVFLIGIALPHVIQDVVAFLKARSAPQEGPFQKIKMTLGPEAISRAFQLVAGCVFFINPALLVKYSESFNKGRNRE